MRISDWSSDVCSSDLAADFAKVSNQFLVTRPIEHADDDLAGIHPLFTRNGLHIFPDRLVEVDDARRIARPHCQLVHVNVGRVQQASFLGNRQHRQRIGASLRSDGRASSGSSAMSILGPLPIALPTFSPIYRSE